jgi:hypothetical protein
MPKFSVCNLMQWLSFILAAMTVPTGILLAQDLVLSPAMAKVEVASLETAPDAPSIALNRVTAEPAAFAAPMPVIAVTPTPKETGSHRFWDRENKVLFAAVGGLATADFFVTRANLASGGRELNPVTRIFAGSTPALAANFALETSGVMGVSYLFHKTGHHKLERFTSLLNAGSSAGAVTYGLTHR